jgi:carboxyl-terminal processing protease
LDTNAVHYSGEFVPLDATAARAWERGEMSDAVPPAGEVAHIEFDVKLYEMSAPVEMRQLAGGVSYVRFNGFGDPDPMKPVHAAIGSAGPAGLILDLRWNAGGLRDQLERVGAALFGEDVPMGQFQDRNGKSDIRTARNVRHFEGPLVVLIGPYSGSAAEVLAAAVQDRKRGRLIGRSTNGSVLQSKSFALPDSGLVQVPVSNFFRIDGNRIEGNGVEPDVWILPTLDDVRARRDPVIDRALQELKKQGHS